MNGKKESVVVIGGGLSGLTCSLLLKRAGFDVILIEKKVYPFHRVCGEYVSNEVIPFLNSIGLDVDHLNPARTSRLTITSPSGSTFSTRLGLGGFGISRYTFDNFLYQRAKDEGVQFLLNEKVTDVNFAEEQFQVTLSDSSTISAGLVIGSFGKRSNLDQKLQRSFFYIRSPYIGVKQHIKTDFPDNLVQLDNFQGGYCGLVKIEDYKYCLCYLAESRRLKAYGSLEALEKEGLFSNPVIRDHFENSDFLFPKPEVINEISFERKSLVEDHILFCGDAAGMITPLCGNGMAMAIHSAKLLAETIEANPDFRIPAKRKKLERSYVKNWNGLFFNRLKAGRIIQRAFGHDMVSNIAVAGLKVIPPISKFIIGLTHGKPF